MSIKSSFKLPAWLTGELLEAWNDYIRIRRKKKIVTDRIMNSRIKELTRFRELKLNLVEIVDSASDGNWRKFYPPKDFVMVEEKPVQLRETKVDSPKIKEIRNKINVEGRRIAKLKSWHNPEERALMNNLSKKLRLAEKDARKLGDLIEIKKPG